MPLASVYKRLRAMAEWLAASAVFLPPLISRLVVGWIFVESGWGKVHNLAGVTAYFQELGIPMAQIQAPMASATELVCGVALMIGVFTRLAAVPLIVIMCVAIWTAQHEFITGAKNWSELFSLSEFLFMVLLTWLAVFGGGLLSADRLLSALFGKHGSVKTPEVKKNTDD